MQNYLNACVIFKSILAKEDYEWDHQKNINSPYLNNQVPQYQKIYQTSTGVDSGLTIPNMLNILFFSLCSEYLLIDPEERSFNA